MEDTCIGRVRSAVMSLSLTKCTWVESSCPPFGLQYLRTLDGYLMGTYGCMLACCLQAYNCYAGL